MKQKKAILLVLFCLAFNSLMAQKPKLHLKVFGGMNTRVFIYKELEKSTDAFAGLQGGFGFRVTYKKFMSEIDFIFLRNGVVVPFPDSLATGSIDKLDIRLNQFELPIRAGWVPIKTPLFKLYCYTGLSMRVNTSTRLILGSDEYEFKPKELGLANPNLDFIIGTQMDVGWLNIDLLYNIGITNSLRENIRTNSHELQLNLGIIF